MKKNNGYNRGDIMNIKEAKELASMGLLEHIIEKNVNGKYYEIYTDKYDGKEEYKNRISKSKYYRLLSEFKTSVSITAKKITINKLSNLIRHKAEYKISYSDSKFVAKELIRLNYCKTK